MASYDEYMSAAKKAHAAGDADSAKRLVGLAKQASLTDGPTRRAGVDARKADLVGRGLEPVATVGEGVVYENNAGRKGYTSPGYSTSDPGAIERVMSEGTEKGVIQSGFDQEAIGQNALAAQVGEFNRGTPFVGSWLDEAVSMASPTAGRSMNALSEAMQREKPGQTMALNALGGLAYGAPMAVAAAPAVMSAAPASTMARVGYALPAGAAAGAIEGAIYGSGEQGGRGRMSNAKTQAAIGGAIGGALGAAGPFIGNLFDSAVKRFKGEDIAKISKELGVSRDAAKILKQAFESNDEDAFSRFVKAGPDAMLADAGMSGRALLDASAQTGGDALRITRNAVESRAANALTATTKGLDDTLGTVRGPRAAAREISQKTAPGRNAAYDAAYNTPIDYASGQGRSVEDAIARVPPATLSKAVREANEEMLARGSGNKQILFDFDSGTFREMPNVQQLDEIKRALDGIGRDNVTPHGGMTQQGARASRLAEGVRDAAIEATGGADGTYAKALLLGGDKIKMDEGLQLGLDMLQGRKITREMFSESMDALPADAKEMVKVGLRSHIDDTLARVNVVASDQNLDAREARKALSMLTSRDAQEKIGLLLGDDAQGLLSQVDRAAAALGMRADVARNSATAVRQSVQDAGKDIAAPGSVGTLMRGQPLDATGRLTQELFATTPADDAAKMGRVWADVARALTETRGAEGASRSLRLINKAIDGQALTDAEARLLANEIATGLTLSGSRSGNQALAPR